MITILLTHWATTDGVAQGEVSFNGERLTAVLPLQAAWELSTTLVHAAETPVRLVLKDWTKGTEKLAVVKEDDTRVSELIPF